MSRTAEITSDPLRLVRNSINNNHLNQINSSLIYLDYTADQGNQNSAAVTDQDSGKEATIHDFLSLSGTAINTTSAILTVAKNGSQSSSVRTQDLLQPLQKQLTPTANKGRNLSPNGFPLGNTQNNTSDYSCSQQIPYAVVNGTSLESALNHHPKYKNENASSLPKSRAAHTTPLNQRWQKGGLEMADGNKRIRPLSEDEDEDEEESMDPYGYNTRKEEHFHKFDRAQQGGNMESNDKGMTPRSKHSATEQRRRSKINDRFQMLRQMLPNSDQKRDKASFLLEVIQYIQMLHEKVRKYEAEDRGLSQQERTKAISWDMASRHKETIQNNLYIPSISTLGYNSREVSDSNGCAQRSPLTTSENTVSGSELMSNNVANYDSKPGGNKPALVAFHQPQSMVYHATSGTMSCNGHYHDEVKAKSSLLSLQQQNNLVSETSTYALDHEYEEFKSLGDIVAVSNRRISTYELQDGKRSNNQFMELQPADIMKNSTKDSEHVSDEIKHERRVSSHHSNRVKCEKMPENSEGSAPTILGGVINISSAYSQGLLNTLTKALQSSGIDLDQARISVQIDLGKPDESNLSKVATSSSLSKELDVPQEPRKRPKLEIDM